MRMRMRTVWPLTTVPGALVYAPLPMLYSPFVTEISDGALVPQTVIPLEITRVLSAAFVTAVKLNASGVESAAAVVTLKVPLTPPIVTVALVVVE